MIIGRFSFGSIGIYFPVRSSLSCHQQCTDDALQIVLNCIACIGWSTINTIVGAQALSAVSSTNQLPVAAGVVLIALITMCFALFGYRHLHMFERYASLPIAVRCSQTYHSASD